MLTLPEDSDSDEPDYASEYELDGPEDSSDEEPYKIDEAESKDDSSCVDRVVVSTVHDQMVTLENSETKISMQEME